MRCHQLNIWLLSDVTANLGVTEFKKLEMELWTGLSPIWYSDANVNLAKREIKLGQEY